MQQQPFWTESEEPVYPILRGRRNADAVVIGGGLSGLTVALWLCRAGLRVTLLEARTVGSGASSHCAGMVSLSNGLMYEHMEQKLGHEVTNAYAQTQQAALQALRELAKEQGDLSGWRDVDAWLVSDEQDGDRLAREAEAMKRAGITVAAEKPTQCPLPATNALLLKDMAATDPVRHMRHITREAERLGLKIFEHSRVVALETNLAYTERGSVLAPYVVVATGYPVVNTPGWYFMRLEQQQSYIMPIEAHAGFDGMYLDANGRYALRKLKDGMLFQLNAGRVGAHTYKEPEQAFLASYAPYLDGAKPTNIYGGIETFSADGLPYIGAYGKKTPNLFVATGYCGRGLIGSMVAAQAISARILGLNGDGYAVYSGQRQGAGVRSAEWKKAMNIGGSYLKSMLHVKAPRCPHMGCKLVYRPRLRMWECPCHGSRFDDIGHVINAPAIHDAPIHHRKKG